MKKTFFAVCFLVCILAAAATATAEAEYDGYIVKLKETGISLLGSDDTMNKLSNDENINLIDYDDKIFTVRSLDEIPDYISSESIECIEPDFKVELFGTVPNDPLYSSNQWNLQIINTPKIWETGCYGQDVKVAVIDSGVNPHSDLADNILEGYNYIDNNTDVTDNTGHGTFVCGIISAATNNSNSIAGIAYRSKIVPLKCFNAKTTDVSLVIKAVKDAVDTYNCKIINLSLGAPQSSSLLESEINNAISKGVIVIAASGNSGNNVPHYPASYPNVISVGSVDSSKVLAVDSTYNQYVDVVAPGVEVFSLLGTQTSVAKGSGTSFATPHVSAVAALCLNINPDMNCADFSAILQHTSEDLGDSGRDDYYGYGLINCENILKNLLSSVDYFVSPCDFESKNPFFVVYNNTGKAASFFSIFSDSYGTELEKIDVDSKAGICLYPYSTEREITHYLWETNLKPVKKTVYTMPDEDDETSGSSGSSGGKAIQKESAEN